MPPRPEKRSDCDQCAALCCIAYASEKTPGFAAEKEAGEPCPKLDSCGECTIYSQREEAGFSGCLEYECFGAGQHIVQHIFDGQDWRDDPALLPPMLEAFLQTRKACDLLYLTDYAHNQPLEHSEQASLEAVEQELTILASTPVSAEAASSLLQIEATLRAMFTQLERKPA